MPGTEIFVRQSKTLVGSNPSPNLTYISLIVFWRFLSLYLIRDIGLQFYVCLVFFLVLIQGNFGFGKELERYSSASLIPPPSNNLRRILQIYGRLAVSCCEPIWAWNLSSGKAFIITSISSFVTGLFRVLIYLFLI